MNEFSYYNYFQIFGTVCEIPVAVNFQNIIAQAKNCNKSVIWYKQVKTSKTDLIINLSIQMDAK